MRRILLAGALLGAVGAVVWAQQQDEQTAKKPQADRGKRRVEARVLEAVRARESADVPDVGKMVVERPLLDAVRERRGADVGKGEVEVPLKRAIADVRKDEEERATKEAIRPGGPEKRVSTGLVAWHESFAAATEAAAKSGKPVLLFQLLGRLDDEWC